MAMAEEEDVAPLPAHPKGDQPRSTRGRGAWPWCTGMGRVGRWHLGEKQGVLPEGQVVLARAPGATTEKPASPLPAATHSEVATHTLGIDTSRNSRHYLLFYFRGTDGLHQ